MNWQNVQKENPPVRSMVERLRDFTKINPPIFTRSKNSKDPKEFMDQVHKILVAMGATDTAKVEMVLYQLKDVAQTWFKIWQHR